MYRHVRNTPLNTDPPITKGQVIREGDARVSASTVQRFLQSGTWVRVSTPPLSEIPGFEDRAGELAKANIITVTDLVEADLKAAAKRVKKSASTLRRWQHEAVKWLEPEEVTND